MYRGINSLHVLVHTTTCRDLLVYNENSQLYSQYHSPNELLRSTYQHDRKVADKSSLDLDLLVTFNDRPRKPLIAASIVGNI